MLKYIFLFVALVIPQISHAQSIGHVRTDYTITPVTTAALVQITAGFSQTVSKISIFDSCGQTLQLYFGKVGFEVQDQYIPPGGGGFPLFIPPKTRVSMKAVTADCTTGQSIINFY